MVHSCFISFRTSQSRNKEIKQEEEEGEEGEEEEEEEHKTKRNYIKQKKAESEGFLSPGSVQHTDATFPTCSK